MKTMKRIEKWALLLGLTVAVALAGHVHAQSGTWETKASTPTPIFGHAVGVANGMLYSVGGASAATCCNNFPAPTFEYDPTTNTWTTKTTMSVKRKNLAAGVVSGVLYAVGGDNDFSYFGTNEAYNPGTDTWLTQASMPTPRAFPSAGVANGILYVVGGENATGTLTNVEAYDPSTNTWSTKAPMLQRRSRGPAVAVVNGTLYVIGGYDTNTGTTLDTVEAYNATANTWTSKASMPTARTGLAGAAVNGIIYAIGGSNNSGILSTVEAYDPATDTWTTVASMPTARSSPGSAEINGVIYAVGGLLSNPPPVIGATVEVFSPPQPACVTPPSGMVSWWPGDGNANDIKDSNNGTLLGGATFAAGKVGQAFSFDGVNGRVLVPAASNLDLEQGFTIDAWVNFADVNSAHCIVCKGLVDNHQYALLSGGLAAPDELNLLVRRQGSASDGLDRLITVNQAHLVPNRWYHIAATADGTNKSIYLDGQLLATNSAVAPYTTFSPAVEIGSGNGGTVAFFHGMIDEVEIYNRALGQAEIQAIYNAGSAGKCKPSANNPPIAVCQSVTVSAGPACTAGASINNGSFDPDGDPIMITQSPPGPYPLGSTLVTLTVTDNHGASSQCTATVTVVDATPPQITSLLADARYQCASQVPPGDASQATATDNCSTPAVTMVESSNGGAGSLSSPLVITRRFSATDAAGNSSSATQTITVVDDTPPQIVCPNNITVPTDPGRCSAVVAYTVTAPDNCSGVSLLSSPPSGSVFLKGTTGVTSTATDAAGNTTTCTFTVTVRDTEPPVIACPASMIVEGNIGNSCFATVNPGSATATDNCPGVSVVGVRSDGQALNAPYPLGNTTITWTATDTSGNQSSCNQLVTVTNPSPVVTITGPATGSVFAVGTPVTFTGRFTDNPGGTHTAQWTFDSLNVSGAVNESTGDVSASYSFSTAGVYLVSLTVSDGCGGASTASTIDGLTALVVVYDPDAGFVTGGGWIDSPAGAYVPNPSLTGRASFGLVSKYQKGATIPTGQTEFQFKVANFNFHSTSYDWLVVAGARARYKGSGTVNGTGNFGFMLTAIDGQINGGGGVDKFRIKIWDKSNGDVIVYDNQLSAPDGDDPTTALGGGSIVIHR